LKRFGIGITDILLKVRRKNNSNLDDNLEIIEYNDKAIKIILENSKIKSIFFTSKFVEKHFYKLFPDFKKRGIFTIAFSKICQNDQSGQSKLL